MLNHNAHGPVLMFISNQTILKGQSHQPFINCWSLFIGQFTLSDQTPFMVMLWICYLIKNLYSTLKCGRKANIFVGTSNIFTINYCKRETNMLHLNFTRLWTIVPNCKAWKLFKHLIKVKDCILSINTYFIHCRWTFRFSEL